MIYCANCFHCKVRVERSGYYNNRGNFLLSGKYYRSCYCAAGIKTAPWDKSDFRKLGAIQTFKRLYCHKYEPHDIHFTVKDIHKMCMKKNTWGELDWYYKKSKRIVHLTRDHYVKRAARSKKSGITTIGFKFPELKRVDKFQFNRLINEEEYWVNLKLLETAYKILTDKSFHKGNAFNIRKYNMHNLLSSKVS